MSAEVRMGQNEEERGVEELIVQPRKVRRGEAGVLIWD
jgi:hypothetical protein